MHGCILVFRDISERKAAEREIGEAQARLQRVVTDMAIPTMVFADDGEVVLVNAAWTGISGYAAAELRTLPAWTRSAYGERAEAMDAVIARLFDLEQSVDNGEREITTASGEKRIWHFVTAPIGRDARGRRMLVTNAIDVTERRRLEQALAEKEARTRLAMEAANYGGWEWDRGSGETVWTDKMRELLDVGADEPISFELFQQRLHPDDRALRERAVAEAWVTGVLRAPSTASSGATARCAGSRRAAGSIAAPTAASACSASSATSPSRSARWRRSRTPTGGRTSSSPRWRTSCATRSRRCATRSRSCSAAPATRRPSTRRAA